MLGLVMTLAVMGQVPAEASAEAVKSFKEQAANYRMATSAKPLTVFELRKSPVLHWGNPARTGEDGAVFVWIADGRPQVIGSIFTYTVQKVYTKHELQSLAIEPLQVRYRDQVAWTPDKAGVEFQVVPGAPVPLGMPRLRVTQMRQIARRFSAILTDERDDTTQLRLMPNPLYRYELDGKGSVADGALFAFAAGTDPEVLLLIEARRSAAGLRWEYALARFHYVALRASLDGKPVWQVDYDAAQPTLQLGDTAHQSKPYISYHVEPAQ